MKKFLLFFLCITTVAIFGCKSHEMEYSSNADNPQSSHTREISENNFATSQTAASVSSCDTITSNAADSIFSENPNHETKIGYWKVPGYDYGSYPSEGLFCVCKNQKFGFLNISDLSIAIPLEYEACGDFFNGVATAKKNGRWGLIDKNNRIILPFAYDAIVNFNSKIIITHPIYRTIWNSSQISAMPDFEIKSYQLYDSTTLAQIYSLDVPIYSDADDQFNAKFVEWISNNKYPKIDLSAVTTKSININELWTYTGTSGVQIEDESPYKVIEWDDTIPYELIELE